MAKNPTLRNAFISFGIGIAGLLYLKHGSFPEAAYKPHVVTTHAYELQDYDRDGDVDILTDKTRLNEGNVRTFYADDMVEVLKTRHPFLDYMGYKSPRMPSEMRNFANLALHEEQEHVANLTAYLKNLAEGVQK